MTDIVMHSYQKHDFNYSEWYNYVYREWKFDQYGYDNGDVSINTMA